MIAESNIAGPRSNEWSGLGHHSKNWWRADELAHKSSTGVPKIVVIGGRPGDTLDEVGRGGVPKDTIGRTCDRGACPELINV